MEKSADDFEFSAERLSENAKSIKMTLVAGLLTIISPIMYSHCNKLSIKTLKHTIFSTTNATLTQKSCDLYDLRTFVAIFFRRDSRTFSADFLRLKSKIRRLLYF